MRRSQGQDVNGCAIKKSTGLSPAPLLRAISMLQTTGNSQLLSCTVSRMASGCFAATCNNTRAGPWGIRRPFSQFRNVFTLIPSIAANRIWESPYFSRMASTLGSSNVNAREGVFSPRRIAPPSAAKTAAGFAFGFWGQPFQGGARCR